MVQASPGTGWWRRLLSLFILRVLSGRWSARMPSSLVQHCLVNNGIILSGRSLDGQVVVWTSACVVPPGHPTQVMHALLVYVAFVSSHLGVTVWHLFTQ